MDSSLARTSARRLVSSLMAASERLERERLREISESSRGVRTELMQTLATFQEAVVR